MNTFFPVKFLVFLSFALVLCVTSSKHGPSFLIKKALVKFSDNFYREVSRINPGNLVTSPVSAHIVLSTAGIGAMGQTGSLMRDALQLPKDGIKTAYGYTAFLKSIKSITNATLDIATSIVVSEKIKLTPFFEKYSTDIFSSKIIPADFSQVDKLVTDVNQWVASKTNGKIDQILSEDNVKPNSQLILLNAIYFKSFWEHKFNKEVTQNSDFQIDATTIKSVPTMFTQHEYLNGVLSEVNANFVILPYANKKISMLIIVPDQVDGLKAIEEMNIDSMKVINLLSIAKKSDTRLFLPKFKIQSRIDLKAPLTKMGMEQIFKEDANFGGITEDTPLAVDRIIQKAFIEVSEGGTEAAAVTEMDIASKMLGETTIRVNKPFYYAILYNGLPLFQGHVIDPTSTQ